MEVVALVTSTDTSLYSASWYRVAQLKPRLRSHVRIHRHLFRKQLWYVLQDQASGRFHRFSPPAYLVISLMDGERSVQEIWDYACSRLADDVLTQDEIIRLLAQLHMADVLHSDVPPDVGEMSERAAKQHRRKLVSKFMNPLAVRVPLLDPDDFLTATMPLMRPLFSWFGALLFLGVAGSGLVLAAMHWPELTKNITDRLLSAESVVLILITYPFVKALHELGHGYAVKRWGGEVHEMGVMFLVFMPVPYVDASASSAFREKWQRALVGAAGIIVELFLATIALLVWLEVEPGMVRAFAFNVMLIGGASTVFFNGNPLLRFDGYYVLSDLLEIPNLGNRANRYIGYLFQRYLFGVRDARSPATAPGEPGWLLSYGLAAFSYRLFIVTVIVLFVATQFFVVGVIMAIWAAVLMIGVPLAKHLWFLLTSPVLRRKRGRAIAVCGAALGVVAGVLLLVPVPYATVAEGVVWTRGESAVYADTDGTVIEILKQTESSVFKGDALIVLEDPFLEAEVRELVANVRELWLRHAAVHMVDLAQGKILGEKLARAEAELALNRQRQRDLVVRSNRDGEFILPRAPDLLGKFVRKGELLGYVAGFENPIVLVIVPEESADLVRQRTHGVEIRLVNAVENVFPAVIERELPALTNRLPSFALSTAGGGEVVMDTSDPDNMKALAKVLQLELGFTLPLRVSTMGGRAYVRFDHGEEPLAWRIYRNIRQLFLRRFNV